MLTMCKEALSSQLQSIYFLQLGYNGYFRACNLFSDDAEKGVECDGSGTSPDVVLDSVLLIRNKKGDWSLIIIKRALSESMLCIVSRFRLWVHEQDS